MIIRRRHTANFTTIGNALFEDERLAADEVGILAYLLSRPHNWEVRRPALMRRWDIGRDAMRRIMNNWLRTGWAQAEKVRLDNGTFHIVYEIRDEPGRELSDDEIRGALSLVSSEATTAKSETNTAADHLRKTGDPPTPKPGVADRRAAGRNWPIEDSLNTDSTKTELVSDGYAREPLISEAAHRLSDDCLAALAINPSDPPPEWHGFPYQAQILIARGYDPLTVVATCARLAHMNPRPPMKYFLKAIEGDCTTPAPSPNTGGNHEVAGRGGKPRSAITAAIDGLIEQLDGGGESGGATSETPPRLLSKR